MPNKIGTVPVDFPLVHDEWRAVPVDFSRSHVNFKIALVNEKSDYPKLHNHFPIQKFFVPAS